MKREVSALEVDLVIMKSIKLRSLFAVLSSLRLCKPTNEDYLSYYVYQREWKPTRPIRPIGAMSSSPGPAIVNLPTTFGEKRHDITRPKAPSYKIGHRTTIDGKSRVGPGPGAYDIRDMTNKGREPGRAPKFSKANRFSDRNTAIASSPGPAAYDRQTGDRYIYPRAPSFSMPHGERSRAKTGATTPGPNSYSLPPVMGPGKTPLVTGSSWSMGKAPRMREARIAQNPGPAAYMLPPMNVNMKKGPAYSMGSKAAPPTAGIHSPGPGAHAAHLVKYNKYSTPRISFGIRHSPYKALPGFAAEK